MPTRCTLTLLPLSHTQSDAFHKIWQSFPPLKFHVNVYPPDKNFQELISNFRYQKMPIVRHINTRKFPKPSASEHLKVSLRLNPLEKWKSKHRLEISSTLEILSTILKKYHTILRGWASRWIFCQMQSMGLWEICSGMCWCIVWNWGLDFVLFDSCFLGEWWTIQSISKVNYSDNNNLF